MNIKYLLIILLLISTLYADKKITTFVKKDGKFLYVYIINKNIFDLTLKVDAKIDFANKSVQKSKIISLKANSKTKVLEVKRLSNRFKYSSKYKWILGNMNSTHDDNYLYRLPYKLNTKQMVSQGFNGNFSHFKQSKYAVDFALDANTKIYAARAGQVVLVKNDFKKGGNSRKFIKFANQITIKHADGTYASYAHLRYKGSIVKEGDFVQRGQFIGYSGQTGYANGPHLHFIVYKAKNHKERESIKVKFIAKRGIIKEPLEKEFYIVQP